MWMELDCIDIYSASSWYLSMYDFTRREILFLTPPSHDVHIGTFSSWAQGIKKTNLYLILLLSVFFNQFNQSKEKDPE